MSAVLKVKHGEEFRRAKLVQEEPEFQDIVELVGTVWPEIDRCSFKYCDRASNSCILNRTTLSDFLSTAREASGQKVFELQLVDDLDGAMNNNQTLGQDGTQDPESDESGGHASTSTERHMESSQNKRKPSKERWVDAFVPKACCRRKGCSDSIQDCFPDPLSTITIYLPKNITTPFFEEQVSYTDCAEGCLLRFVQLCFLIQADNSRMLIDCNRLSELGAESPLLDYFECFSEVLPHGLTSLEARSAWAALVTRRVGCAYVRAGGFEMNAGVGNFLATLRSLFPKLPIPEDVLGRSDDGEAIAKALDTVCIFFSTPAKKISITNFEFVGPLHSRTKDDAWDALWMHPVTHGRVSNTVAVDRETSLNICVNDYPIYHFDLWDRHFLAEGYHEEVTSGHAEMSHADPPHAFW